MYMRKFNFGEVKMLVKNLDTPALIVDEKILQQNIEAMNKILKGTQLKLRPHYKSHKCAAFAKIQVKNGAKGMTCAKLSEAADLVDCGIEDILIANQITDLKKIRRLASLAGDCRLTICVDNALNIKAISKAAKEAGTVIYCLVEYEIGMERCGVNTKEEVLNLAREIEKSDNLVFDGIQAYAGHVSHIVDEGERKKLTEENDKKIKNLLKYLKQNSINVNTVSGGSTGTASIKASLKMYNELQAGSYLFMDSTYSELKLPFENSLFLLTSVISAKGSFAVVDAGVKTCGVDQGMPKLADNCAEKIVASEEHFQLHGLKNKLNVGDKIKLIPAHCCSTVNLFDKIYLVENGKVKDRLLITARGMGK